jgi:hypothetical protein
MQGSRTKRFCTRVKYRPLVIGSFTDDSHARIKDRALVLDSLTEGSYPRVKDRSFIGILSMGQEMYDSFTFANKGVTVFRNVGSN